MKPETIIAIALTLLIISILSACYIILGTHIQNERLVNKIASLEAEEIPKEITTLGLTLDNLADKIEENPRVIRNWGRISKESKDALQ